MKPNLITSVTFNDEGHLSDFLNSTELTAQEVRADLVSRLKRGEGLVVAVAESPARALVLRSAIDAQHKGQLTGNDLVLVPFA